ncbi:MAG: GNAT family N-acetyltransferase, partial [Endomicrobiia bacterium]
MEILQASAKDAKEILDLQKTAFESEAELYGNYSIEPLNQ